jgi:hypothetical protein
MRRLFLPLSFLLLMSLACGQGTPVQAPPKPTQTAQVLSRLASIPANAVKISPATDIYPPRSFSNEFEDPLPMPGPINTAGAEDSAYMLPDGKTFFVWFTPAPDIPVEKQITDGVTGIYVSHKVNDVWSNPERVVLQDPGKLALDGCEFVLGDRMWFCSAREGYTGLHWFTADFKDGKWQNWQLADFKPEYEVGELHITADGNELYFHSSRPGGQGGYDIWASTKSNGTWGEPVNVEIVNSPYSDGWPFVSPDGLELWFTRSIGAPELWRSKRVNGTWSPPEKMFAPFAGEASMDQAGNVYFTHHFYKDDHMLEADIYVAYKK